jgi:hypothetical protein
VHLRDHPVRSLLLLLVGLAQAATGLWAVIASRDWYDRFPGFGHAWVAAYGPYDDHLAADAGAGLLALGLLLAGAAMVARRAELRLAIAAFLVFAAIHLSFHLRALGRLPRLDDALTIASLGLTVAIPLGVLLSLGSPTAASEDIP